MDINIKIANRKWNRAQIRKSKKQLIYCFRYLNYATIISKKYAEKSEADEKLMWDQYEWKDNTFVKTVGEINFDETDSNSFSFNLLTKVYSSWEDLFSYFEHNMDRKMKELDSTNKHFQHFEKERHQEWLDGKGYLLLERNEKKCLIIEYIKQFGLSHLVYGLSLRLSKIDKKLICFSCTYLSPARETSLFMTDRCNGLVIDTSTNQVVCWPFPRYMKYNMPHQTFEAEVFGHNFTSPQNKPEKFKKQGENFTLPIYQFDWDNVVTVYPYTESYTFSLFYHEEWKMVLTVAPNIENFSEKRIYEYFWQVWKKCKYEFPDSSFRNIQFQLVLCTNGHPEHSYLEEDFKFCLRNTFCDHDSPNDDYITLQSIIGFSIMSSD
eukprot:TRINITY_DN9297_c0_g1_i1.p1 TRINITY_DN9297_c0_g1~~TRINITY_DN9297_c0_g1_i1.p1  ORF type:complete len:386 (-),score=71.11 TRINITY_DN9297_c0_g1_i1:317-1453(-)